jgi:hypothetical protein
VAVILDLVFLLILRSLPRKTVRTDGLLFVGAVQTHHNLSSILVLSEELLWMDLKRFAVSAAEVDVLFWPEDEKEKVLGLWWQAQVKLGVLESATTRIFMKILV